jgi:hypothetical protein
MSSRRERHASPTTAAGSLPDPRGVRANHGRDALRRTHAVIQVIDSNPMSPGPRKKYPVELPAIADSRHDPARMLEVASAGLGGQRVEDWLFLSGGRRLRPL